MAATKGRYTYRNSLVHAVLVRLVKKYRNENKLFLWQVAEQCGISEKQVYVMVNDRDKGMINFAVAVKILWGLGISLAEFEGLLKIEIAESGEEKLWGSN